MNSLIEKCKKCKLHKNQAPLLDHYKKTCNVMWVGLSAKKIKNNDYSYPLASDTNSGKLIYGIETTLPNISFYKTNLVKCLPLDNKNKIRYPHKEEIEHCLPNLIKEINSLKPQIIFLLGNLVSKSFNNYIKKHEHEFLLKKVKILKIKHPSYIVSYKRKTIISYKEEIVNIINNEINFSK